MARNTNVSCDFCGAKIEKVAAKLYLAPVLPGKASTSFMSGYSHSADLCEDCLTKKFIPKMRKRQSRPSNGTTTVKRKRGRERSGHK